MLPQYKTTPIASIELLVCKYYHGIVKEKRYYFFFLQMPGHRKIWIVQGYPRGQPRSKS